MVKCISKVQVDCGVCFSFETERKSYNYHCCLFISLQLPLSQTLLYTFKFHSHAECKTSNNDFLILFIALKIKLFL